MRIFGRIKFSSLYIVMLASTAVAQPAHALENSESLENLSGIRGSTVFHTLEVPQNASRLSISISGGSGDADLYVKFGSKPTTSSYHCRPYRNGNNESCVADSPSAGTYHIMIRGYADFNGVKLTASYSGATSVPTSAPDPDPAPAPTPSEDQACINAVEQELLDAHNAARSQGRSCGGEYFEAAAPLQWSCPLRQAAFAHSNDMASVNFFSHTGSDGSSAGQRITNAGYNWQAWGENIAAGQTSVPAVMQGWLNSPGHCEGIMNPNFTQIGSARVDNSNSQYNNYWTTVFARPQ